MLILFALPLALSPPRPGRLLLLPALIEVDDLDFIESPLLDDGPGGGFCADVAPAVYGLAVMMFFGLFCPVLLLLIAAEPEVGAVDGLASLLMRCVGIVGSEGSLDIKGGLGGRAEVNL